MSGASREAGCDGARGPATILEEILDSTRAQVQQRKREHPIGGLHRDVDVADHRFRAALAKPSIGIIAEIKRRSPSAGRLREDVDVAQIASTYQQGGADAISVLTEGPHFEGSLADLAVARQACGLPILRKDFIIDPYQVHEAVAAGAAAILLIVAAIAPSQLAALHAQALACGLDVLVEVHDASEVEIALAAGAQIVGVNNRDLRDFSVDVERTFSLRQQIPRDALVVSESGISSSDQLVRLQQAGVDAVLVGESLMRAPDPAAALRSLRPAFIS